MKLINFIAIISTILLSSSNVVFADFASDSVTTGLVKTKIELDPALSKTDIKVTTNDGVVTLQGTVNSESEGITAVQTAQSVSGVRDVDTSKLNIKSSKQPFKDSYITAKIKGKFIQEKLFDDKDIAAMSIHIETTNGIVFLSGSADNSRQVKNAIRIAQSVSGVKEVKTNITVSE